MVSFCIGTIRIVSKDFNKFQEDLISNARALANSTQNSIEMSVDKKDFRKLKRDLEEELKKLNGEGSVSHVR